ncbi:TPA: hypothetical protein ACI4A0_003696, partial [Proteus mirabilis]
GGNNLASMAVFRSREIRFMCHSSPSGLCFRGGDNYPDTEGVYIDIIKIGDSLKIKSKKNILLNSDNTDSSELEKYLSQSYLDPNLDMDIFLYPQKSGGYVFFTNDMYAFYCK